MSRLYHTLVVLGGALVGCGAKTHGDAETFESAPSDGSGDSAELPGAPSESGTNQASGRTGMSGSATGDEDVAVITTLPTGAGAETPMGGSPVAAAEDPEPMDDASSESSSEAPPAEDSPEAGEDANDAASPEQAPPFETTVGQAPSDCPSAQWACGPISCDWDVHCYGPSGPPSDPPCPAPVEGTCVCDAAAPTSPSQCGEGQLFTCLYGAFELEDGSAQALPYDCRCLDRDATTGLVPCSDHPGASENTTGRGDADFSELWCGNCAVPLIR